MGNTVPLLGEVWMPWKECSVMDERLRFVARLLDGEAMSLVCREFGFSRKTGYKIFERYKSARGCHPCLRYDLSPCVRTGQRYNGAGEGIRTLDPNLGKVGDDDC